MKAIPDSWRDMSKALEEAFLKLERPEALDSAAIPYGHLIPGIARQLMLMKPVPKRERQSAKKNLKALVSASSTLIAVLDSMPDIVADALNYRNGKLSEFKTSLRIMHSTAANADIQGLKGAPPQDQKRRVAEVVAQHYVALTGKKPTVPTKDGKAYGPFLSLLREIYKKLEMKPGAESQAKEMARKWKSI